MIGLDTNILAYAEGINDGARQAQALKVLGALPVEQVVVPVQVLGELFRVLTGKARRPASEARDIILSWRDAFDCRDTSSSALLAAMDLSVDHGLSIWDALIMAVAADAGCRILVSEDLQDGFTWRGVTVVNPFAAQLHPLLAAIMNGTARH